MTESTPLERARQGDPQAIAQLLSSSPRLEGVSIFTRLQDDCLQITLSAEQDLDQGVLVNLIHRGLSKLAITSRIATVKIYGKQTNQTLPVWTEEIQILSPPSSHSRAIVNAESSLPDPKLLEKPLSLRQRAKQGEITALVHLLNQALEHKQMTIKARLQGSCLQLLVESQQFPDQTVAAILIQRTLAPLKIPTIETVRLFGRQVGSQSPSWTQEVKLTSPPPALMTQKAAVAQPVQSRNFPLSYFIPYQEVFGVDLYNNGTLRLLLFFSLFPLTMKLILGPARVSVTAWILGIYYAVIWGVVLYDLIKPARFSWSDTLKCALFTTFIGIPLLLIMQNQPPFNALYAGLQQGAIARLIGYVLGVGLLEELCKAAPVYLLLFRTRRLTDPSSAAFYGAMSGLGFAIAEGVQYSKLYARVLVEGDVGLGPYILINTIRFISLPLFHAIWAGIVGYFIGLAALNPSRQLWVIAIGIGIAAVLHGLYDVFSSNLLGVLIMAFSILLFVTYLCRSQEMAEVMRQFEEETKMNEPAPKKKF